MSHCCAECQSLSLELKTGTAIHFESVLRTLLYRPTEYLCAAESSLHPNHLKPWGLCKHLALLLLRVRNVAPEQIWQIKGQKLILTSLWPDHTQRDKKNKKKGGSGVFFAYRCTFVLPYHLSSCCGAVGRVWLPKIKRLLTFLLHTKAALKSVFLSVCFVSSDWKQSHIKMEILPCVCTYNNSLAQTCWLSFQASEWAIMKGASAGSSEQERVHECVEKRQVDPHTLSLNQISVTHLHPWGAASPDRDICIPNSLNATASTSPHMPAGTTEARAEAGQEVTHTHTHSRIHTITQTVSNQFDANVKQSSRLG